MYLEMHLPSTIPNGMTYKTNSSDIFKNLDFESTNFLTNICYDLLFNKLTETIRNSAYFSTAKTVKNSLKKLVKSSDEFVVT